MKQGAFFGVVSILVASACGSSLPSAQLRDARFAFAQMRNGDAVLTNPEDVEACHRALRRAEEASQEGAPEAVAIRLAVQARMRAQRAMRRSEALKAQAKAEQANSTYRRAFERRNGVVRPAPTLGEPAVIAAAR